MKIGVISDLHLDFWGVHNANKFFENMEQYKEEVDVMIFAGDMCNQPLLRNMLIETLQKSFPNLIYCRGNHDFYYGDVEHEFKTKEIDGVKFAATTLWTDFQYRSEKVYNRIHENLYDSTHIRNYNFETMLEQHDLAVKDLTENKADIIVTHHMPTYQSVATKYIGSPLNGGFVSDLNPLIEELKPKFWIHGHTHERMDYMFNETTAIICNPLGYPNENYMDITRYHPAIIEV